MADISQINLPNDNNSPYNIKDASVPHSSLPAEVGGTDLSLVTTDEKATWNSGSSDTKVTQTETSSSYSYEILFASTYGEGTRTEEARKSSNLRYCPNSIEPYLYNDGARLSFNLGGDGGVVSAKDIQIGWVYNNENGTLKRSRLFRHSRFDVNKTAAASGWTSILDWSSEIVIVDFSSWSYTTNDNSCWGHLSVQWSRTNGDIRVLNIRNQTAKIDAFYFTYYDPNNWTNVD